MLKQYRTRLWSFTVDELQPFLLLRLQLALSFFLQFSDALCGNRHGIGGDIVTVHNVLKREYEFAVHYLVGAEFADQNRDIVFVRAIIIGARRQHPRGPRLDVRVSLAATIHYPA